MATIQVRYIVHDVDAAIASGEKVVVVTLNGSTTATAVMAGMDHRPWGRGSGAG